MDGQHPFHKVVVVSLPIYCCCSELLEQAMQPALNAVSVLPVGSCSCGVLLLSPESCAHLHIGRLLVFECNIESMCHA